MIDPRDLRINNLVYDKDRNIATVDEINIHSQVFTIDKTYDDWRRPIKPEGIPLNEEWLIRLGFEKDYYGLAEVWTRDDVSIFQHSETSFSLYRYNDRKVYIPFVHRLQNVFYDLTGEELSIVEPKERQQ